jgi:uncharacterized delta-60 repeat protein
VAWGAAGSFDATYGSGGIATQSMPAGRASHALALQSGGQVLLAGVEVRRFTSAGAPDTAFGSGGVAALPGSQTASFDLALDADDILAGGSTLVTTTAKGKTTSQTRAAVARFDDDGALVTGFGSGGLVVLSVPNATQSSATAVVVQPDHRVVVAGTASLPKGKSSQQAWFLARLTSSGSLDSTFGAGGFVVHDPSTLDDAVRLGCLGLLPDGRIVVGGSRGGTTPTALVARFSAAGGFETSLARSSSVLNVLTVDGAGRILAGGMRVGHANSYVTRILSGVGGLSLDSGFGTGGEAVIGLSGYSSFVPAPGRGIAVDAAGAIVACAHAQNTGVSGTAVWVFRLTSDGSLDASFGSSGFAGPVDLATHDVANGLAVDGSGRVLVGGRSFDGGANLWFGARLSAD